MWFWSQHHPAAMSKLTRSVSEGERSESLAVALGAQHFTGPRCGFEFVLSFALYARISRTTRHSRLAVRFVPGRCAGS